MSAEGCQPEHSERVARQFDRVAGRYLSYDEVPQQIATRLFERLDYLAMTPQCVLDLGCGPGRGLAELRRRYRKARIIGVDISADMLSLAGGSGRWWRRPKLLQADAHNLPLESGSVDLVVSNLMLPWCHDPYTVFEEIYRVLRPGGAVLFSSCGPDTLLEYRDLWASVDQCIHDFGLIDMHHLGDSMLAAGFSAPVLDRENLEVSYPTVGALEVEMQALGAANLAMGRRRGLMNDSVRKELQKAAGTADRFRVTLELIQGHAWKESAGIGDNRQNDEFVFSLDQMKQQIRG